MPTEHEAIIEAFRALGGVRTIGEIHDWVRKEYGDVWKDFGTRMADMVPRALGGNPTSTVSDQFRVLRRVGGTHSGQYCLITDKILQKPEYSNDHKTAGSSVSSPRGTEHRNLESNLYQIMRGRSSVKVWSTERLPFEPKGWLSQLRTSICSAVKGIECDRDQLLCAIYTSPVREVCDVENILFYNVGTGCFAQSYGSGIRFERAFSQPPQPQKPMYKPARHYHLYKTVPKTGSYEYWIPTETLVQWSTSIPVERMKLLNPSYIWYWTKRGSIRLVKKPHQIPQQFGMNMKIMAPVGSISNFVALLKPILDGVVAAFHQHDETMQIEVAGRLAHVLGVRSTEISTYLNENTNAVLGKRRLLWPWRNGIQWNPADECCVAGELLFNNSTKNSLELSGKLFEVREKLP